MRVGFFCPHVCLCNTYMSCPWRPEEMIRSLKIGVTEDCEPSCMCLRLKPEPLEEQPLLLTTELFLQLQPSPFKAILCTVFFSHGATMWIMHMYSQMNSPSFFSYCHCKSIYSLSTAQKWEGAETTCLQHRISRWQKYWRQISWGDWKSIGLWKKKTKILKLQRFYEHVFSQKKL